VFEQKARVALAGAALAFDSGGTPPTSTAASFFVLLPPPHPMQGSDLPTLAYRRLLVGELSQPRGRVERRTLWVTSQSILNVVQVRGFKIHPPFNFARMLDTEFFFSL